jgi:hypothetical protein
LVGSANDITPTLIYRFCLQLSLYRLIINKNDKHAEATERRVLDSITQPRKNPIHVRMGRMQEEQGREGVDANQ